MFGSLNSELLLAGVHELCICIAMMISYRQVDLVVAAHEHLYMRMCPQAHGVCVPGETGTVKAGSAPVYVIDGTGGA